MSWSGEYVLKLVCDTSSIHWTGAEQRRHLSQDRAEFKAQSASAARQAARRAGWLVHPKTRACLCPDCRVTLFTGTVDKPVKP